MCSAVRLIVCSLASTSVMFAATWSSTTRQNRPVNPPASRAASIR